MTEVRILVRYDRDEGRNEEQCVEWRIAACIWIYTKAVLCDGQESTQENLRKLSTIMESVSWVCKEAMEAHEWVSEPTISMQENEILVVMSCHLDVPCVIQWRLWFSPPSRLNARFADMAIEATLTMPFENRTRHERVC